ncbi:FadD3 family acyl-CoA ligase [Rhodococcus sp. G-MC3]|uniref:FadD3 family acyl-CoA ligase n=1 Tax=Rhodococcus sp. G-MC3 TaxID=3046209 RepID=UPI0024B9D8DC|nr:FadD3 family acyl-CoA ligase [Rhodococcus sp. G-MC3]MDJ0394150.1 FadD3 family acyl-CoA ligase [Rhodococcus sp. G-MC3]
MTEYGQTTPSALAHAAAAFGDDNAIVDGSRTITFGQLRDVVLEAARAFCTLGVQPGDAVAIWAPNTYQWVISALAAHHAGGVLIPINTRYTTAEATELLKRTRARLLVVPEVFLGVDRSAELDLGALPGLNVVTFPMDAQSRASDSAGVSWDRLPELAVSTPESVVAERASAVTADTIGDILFTSGTTGRSKGAMSAHRQSLSVARAWAECTGLRRQDRYLVVNPFFHSFGFKAGILAALTVGATIYPMAVYDPDTALALIVEHRITVLPGAPTIFSTILDHPGRRDLDLSSLRLAVTGAAVVPVRLIERMRDELTFETILTAYGLTEAVVATMCRPGDDDDTVASTSGGAAAGFEIRIGDNGEIQLRGPNVMLGYLDDPVATAAAVDHNGWLGTGDVGTLDDRGYLTVTDRLKDMYISGGFNVYPAEVEQVLLEFDGVADVAVVGKPDHRMGEVGVAVVVPAPGANVAGDDLIAYSRSRLAGFKVPTSVELRRELPRNAGGKVLKRVLREELR